MPDATTHPTLRELTAFGLGILTDEAADAVAAHLEVCEACQQVVADLPPDSFMGKVRAAKPTGNTAVPGDTPPKTSHLSRTILHKNAPPALPIDLPADLAAHSKYQIIRELGRGGMGVVYQAVQTMMDRQVALKVINPSVLAHPTALPRFQAEVKAAAKLDHPNIVRAHDAEQVGSLHLLVMELVDGITLADLVKKKGPQPIAHSCHFIRQTALGLQHAFERGMVHRDIKPQNLMVTPKGVVKILDFGLARLRRQSTQASMVGGITEIGAFMGTPEYVSPEQATDARTADTRSDLYSLGCTFYFLLTGRPPFVEQTVVQMVLAQIVKTPLSVHQFRADIPDEIAAVVAGLLEKDPWKRFQRPGELAEVLEPFIRAEVNRKKNTELPVETKPELPGTETMIAAVADQIEELAADPEALIRHASLRRMPTFSFRFTIAATILALAFGSWLLFGVILKTKVKTVDGEAFVVLEVEQAGALVRVDEQQIAVEIPDDKIPVEIKVEPGRHTLRISKQGFEAVTRDVELTTGKTSPIKVRLEPARKKVEVATVQPLPLDRKPSTVINGEWRVEDDELVQPNTKAPAFIFFGEPSWTDYDVSCETKTVAGTEGTKVFFHATAPDNYYAFAVGSYEGKWNETFRMEIGRWHRHVPPIWQQLTLDRWYAMRVRIRGEHVQCFLDGTKVFDYSDAHFPKGRVGLSSWCSSVRWKNIKVTTPDGRVLWEGPPDLGPQKSSKSEPSPANPNWSVPSPVVDRKAKITAGTWRIDGDELVQTEPNTANCRLSFGDPNWTNYDYSFEAVKTDGPFGLSSMFRVADLDNFLLFDLAGWNRRFVVEYFGTQGYKVVNNHRPGYMNKGQKYRVKVEVRDVHIRCFVDDTLIYDFLDNRLPRGGVGLRPWCAAVRVRDLKVTDPDGKVLWEGLPDLAHQPKSKSSQSSYLPIEGSTSTGTRASPIDPAVRQAYKFLDENSVWQIDRDELVQQNSNVGEAPLVFGSAAWKDYDFSCEGKQVFGRGEVGILFRVNGTDRREFVLGRYTGTWQSLVSVDDGNRHRLREENTGAVQVDRWYKLRVRVRGSNCQCFVDDQLAFDVIDDKNPVGAVGVWTWQTRVRFRNLRVIDPSGKILFEGLPTLPARALPGKE